MMEQRPLGKTATTVSAVGMGCGGLSEGYGPTNDEQSLETLEAALDHGVNFFDTSDVYGQGHGERLLGQFLRRHPGATRVATKFGLVMNPGAPPTINNSPAYVSAACDASLKRLGVEAIDVYYIHRRNADVPIEDVVGAMAELVRAGKVHHIGLCEVSPATLQRAVKVHPIAAVQSEYSLWTRDPERGVLDACREFGVTFVAYCPLGRGVLTGEVTSLEALDAKDFRRRLPRFQPAALDKNLSLVHSLDEFASRHSATRAQVALAWLLCRNSSVIPIPGTKRVSYVAQNAAATRVKLSAAEIKHLDELFAPSAVTGERYPAPAMQGIEI